MNKNTYYIIGAVIAVVALVGGWYYFMNREEIPSGPDYTISMENATPPSLERPNAFDPNIPTETRLVLEGNVTTLRTKLRENPLDFWAWMDLSMQYKVGGDIEGARDIWEFLNVASPKQSVSFVNLGSLYHFQFREFEKSEQMYKKAIEIEPAKAAPYLGLFDLYRYSYKKDTTLAVDTLNDGLTQVTGPEKIDIHVALGSYFKASGDTARALEQYIRARDAAIEAGNQALVNTLNQEVNSIAGISVE